MKELAISHIQTSLLCAIQKILIIIGFYKAFVFLSSHIRLSYTNLTREGYVDDPTIKTHWVLQFKNM